MNNCGSVSDLRESIAGHWQPPVWLIWHIGHVSQLPILAVFVMKKSTIGTKLHVKELCMLVPCMYATQIMIAPEMNTGRCPPACHITVTNVSAALL